MNAAWNLWIMCFGMFALTLVMLLLVMMHLNKKYEEREKNLTGRNDNQQRRPDKYIYKYDR
jgi:hypothetical protein